MATDLSLSPLQLFCPAVIGKGRSRIHRILSTRIPRQPNPFFLSRGNKPPASQSNKPSARTSAPTVSTRQPARDGTTQHFHSTQHSHQSSPSLPSTLLLRSLHRAAKVRAGEGGRWAWRGGAYSGNAGVRVDDSAGQHAHGPHHVYSLLQGLVHKRLLHLRVALVVLHVRVPLDAARPEQAPPRGLARARRGCSRPRTPPPPPPTPQGKNSLP